MKALFSCTSSTKPFLYLNSCQLRRCLHRQFHSLPPSPSHLNSLLLNTKKLRHGVQIHAQIIKNNYLSLPILHTNLINMYANCGQLNQSLLIFSNAQEISNIVTWTSLITHFSHTHKPYEALALFSRLRATALHPNHFTFSAILHACADTELVIHGDQIHTLARKHGFLSDVFVGSAVAYVYAKFADMGSSKRMFDEMPERNIVSWNTLLVGFVCNEMHDKAIGFFRDMIVEESISLDQVSFSTVFSACGKKKKKTGGLGFGRQVQVHFLKLGLGSSAYAKNSLLDMYSKCGCFEEAVFLFNSMEDRDVVTWNIMAMGWAQNDRFEEACNCFWIMRREGISPDEASFSTALHASASLAALDQGILIHDQITKTGFMRNQCVGNSLLTMYAKCGSLDDAHRTFQETREHRNVVSWTAMIAALHQHGYGEQVIELFEEMLREGIEPDYITFVSILSACSHNGLLEKGFVYYNSMSKVYKMTPGHEHCACMVDMLGRAGRLDEARKFIDKMPVEPDVSVWGALLGACRNYHNLEMGKEVAHRLFEMEPDNPGNYVLLSNIYSWHGRLVEAKEVRRLMGLSGVRKETGCSWIDIKNNTYVFTVHDKSHHRTYEIYEMLARLKDLVKKTGYVAETQFAINDVGEKYKEQSLWYHSERLAVAFGLISLPASAPIRIKKNLRTCGDCHTVMKYISEIFGREIIVRDSNRFHRFTDGSCSCRDYWKSFEENLC